MTSFSMPSIALSNSAAEALRQRSDSLILVEINYEKRYFRSLVQSMQS